jgi:hypothetical protein
MSPIRGKLNCTPKWWGLPSQGGASEERKSPIPRLPKTCACFTASCWFIAAFTCGHNGVGKGEGKLRQGKYKDARIPWDRDMCTYTALKITTACKAMHQRDHTSLSLCSVVLLCCESLPAFLFIPVKYRMRVVAFKVHNRDHSGNRSWL